MSFAMAAAVRSQIAVRNESEFALGVGGLRRECVSDKRKSGDIKSLDLSGNRFRSLISLVVNCRTWPTAGSRIVQGNKKRPSGWVWPRAPD